MPPFLLVYTACHQEQDQTQYLRPLHLHRLTLPISDAIARISIRAGYFNHTGLLTFLPYHPYTICRATKNKKSGPKRLDTKMHNQLSLQQHSTQSYFYYWFSPPA